MRTGSAYFIQAGQPIMDRSWGRRTADEAKISLDDRTPTRLIVPFDHLKQLLDADAHNEHAVPSRCEAVPGRGHCNDFALVAPFVVAGNCCE
jgi:hypothetical protein